MVEERKTGSDRPGDDSAGEDVPPQVLEEPGAGDGRGGEPPTWEIEDEPESPWMRGLFMLIFAALFELGKVLLLVGPVLQFLWLLFAKEKNAHIAGFGRDLSDWFARVTRFQSGATEEKPFPFARWGESE